MLRVVGTAVVAWALAWIIIVPGVVQSADASPQSLRASQACASNKEFKAVKKGMTVKRVRSIMGGKPQDNYPEGGAFSHGWPQCDDSGFAYVFFKERTRKVLGKQLTTS